MRWPLVRSSLSGAAVDALVVSVMVADPVCVAHFGGVLLLVRRLVADAELHLVKYRCYRRPPLRPVLKHGPRSVTSTRVREW